MNNNYKVTKVNMYVCKKLNRKMRLIVHVQCISLNNSQNSLRRCIYRVYKHFSDPKLSLTFPKRVV